MIVQVQEKQRYTLDEYLDREINSEERNEYVDGEIVPMTGGTPDHNTIVGNFYATLNFALKRQPYRVFVTDQRLWIAERRIYTYPDIMVVQGKLQLQAGRKDTIVNPMMIVEVLSASTQAYDRAEKFKAYRTLPTFREYILIEQSEMQVEHYYKADAQKWTFVEYAGEAATLSLNSIAVEIPLVDLYDKVDFELEQ